MERIGWGRSAPLISSPNLSPSSSGSLPPEGGPDRLHLRLAQREEDVDAAPPLRERWRLATG